MIFSDKFVSECQEYSTYTEHIPAPIFRKSFEIQGNVSQGEIVICGLGFYDLFLNGQKITKGLLAPYISNPDHILYYDRYDIAPYLQQGENVISIMLGDGFLNCKTHVWDFSQNVFRSAPKLAVHVVVEDEKDRLEWEAPDFKCRKGSICFNDLRNGVFFDKRLEPDGWKICGFVEDESWHRPILVERPKGEMRFCEAEPVVITGELKPVKICAGELADYEAKPDVIESLGGKDTVEQAPVRTGGYIFDFGENNTGIFRMKIKGWPGQRIDIQCGELLKDGAVDYGNMYYYPDGYAQRDIYIVGSEQEEIFEPMFTYHGFRYLYVSGITEEQASSEFLTYLTVSSNLKERGSFVCSDETANSIYKMARRSDISNFTYFPTDCPHREKNGWMGDAAASAEHMLLTIEAERSFREWLHNVRCAQREDGKLPCIIPTDTWGYDWGSGPAWDRALFEIPYCIWKYRGETLVLKENADAMMRYLKYISNLRNENGIIAVGLGDWVPVDREGGDYQAPLGFTDSVMVYDMCRKGESMFETLGLYQYAAFAVRLEMELLEAIRKQYLNLDTMMVQGSCQTSQAIGIYYDIFTDREKPEAFLRLMEILKRDGEKLTCGFLGTRVLYHVLSEFGESELAWRMITGKDFPAYGYLVEQGFTTLPEQFLSGNRMQTISQNHHFLGDVVQWFMRYPGGIRIMDSTHVVIRPEFIEGVSYVQASHTLPAGNVSVLWKRKDGRIRLVVNCPEGVAYQVETGKWKEIVDMTS